MTLTLHVGKTDKCKISDNKIFIISTILQAVLSDKTRRRFYPKVAFQRSINFSKDHQDT